MTSSHVINCINVDMVSWHFKGCLYLHHERLMSWALYSYIVYLYKKLLSIPVRRVSGVLSQHRPHRKQLIGHKTNVANHGPFLQCFLSSLICFITFAAKNRKLLSGNPVSLLKFLGCSQSQGLSSLSGPCSLFFLLIHCVLDFYSVLCYHKLTLFSNEWNLIQFLIVQHILHTEWVYIHITF
jgi:hypothetical protein